MGKRPLDPMPSLPRRQTIQFVIETVVDVEVGTDDISVDCVNDVIEKGKEYGDSRIVRVKVLGE